MEPAIPIVTHSSILFKDKSFYKTISCDSRSDFFVFTINMFLKYIKNFKVKFGYYLYKQTKI